MTYLSDEDVARIERDAVLGITTGASACALIETLRETQAQNALLRSSLYFSVVRLQQVIREFQDVFAATGLLLDTTEKMLATLRQVNED